MILKRIPCLILCCLSLQLMAQETFPVNGVDDERERFYAFTNAVIHQDHNTVLKEATLIIKKGKVQFVRSGNNVPQGAVEIDLKGKHIYPSMIEIYSNYGLPEVKSQSRSWSDPPQTISKKDGAYGWNEALKTEFDAFSAFNSNSKSAKSLRNLGFGAVLTHRMDGISRGTSAFVLLGDERANEVMVKDKVAHHLSFKKGSSRQNYPSSLMGGIALLRQTNYDAQWYKNGGQSEEYNISLDAWNGVSSMKQIFEVRDWQEALRASKVAKEFGQSFIFKGAGDEYQRIEQLKALNTSFIVPVNFPKAYDVEDPFDANNVTLAQMMHWELAPSNASRLAKANIPFAFTSHGLKKQGDYLKMIKKAIDAGLDKKQALRAITSGPAEIAGLSDKIGSLKSGMIANFIITDKELFSDKVTIYENWVNGKPYVLKDRNDMDLSGAYALTLNRTRYNLKVKGKPGKPTVTMRATGDTTDTKVTTKLKDKLIQLTFKDKGGKYVRLSGDVADKTWQGRGTDANGDWVNWTATRTGDVKEEEDKKKKESPKKEAKDTVDKVVIKETTDEAPVLSEIRYPFMGYGITSQPAQETYLLKNATVWTLEGDGKIEGADVLISGGKIRSVGKSLKAPGGAKVVDASGKHVTPGIIDEHSHIAISRGVNEGTQASSAEVRIGDVVNSEDVNIYRQLGGGVTMAQLLHGSANPIGGQSAIIKMRWGKTPEEMKVNGARGYIKFALGENVKQSNWGDNNRSRFPQTRMGVEQVYDDHFTRAKAYESLRNSGKARKDLELDALLEILKSERFITCHSYVQSEINMLMKVAERYGFRINTFTHILEGYKVADKMKAHGAGGSTFADWWAYKYEVIDAIPHNADIMHDQGIVVAINSDDAEMGRRLNQEAAKAVQYSQMDEVDALKMVTLNPAKLLRLDNRMGSIKSGKDADVVLWSDHPLSVYAKAEMTFVDGIKYYDLKDDLANRKRIHKERTRLIQKMLEEKKGGGKTQKPKKHHQHLYHCDHVHDELID